MASKKIESPCSILQLFGPVDSADSRKPRGKRHPLQEILLLILIGYLIGLHSYRQIARFFRAKDHSEEFLAAFRPFLPMEHGFPDSSTMSRAISGMDPVPLVTSFADFMSQMVPHPEGQQAHICIDGKAIRAALNKKVEGWNLYIVNVLDASTHLFLYQMRVGKKTAEAPTIEEEIATILLGNPSMVTMDAMGARTTLIHEICRYGSSAVLPLKRNNKLFMEAVRNLIVEHALSDTDTDDASDGDTAEQAPHFPPVTSHVDLNGYQDSDDPSLIISNVVCKVFEEDNHSDLPDTADPPQPVSEFPFFDNIYSYDAGTDDFHLNPENRRLVGVQIGDRIIRMVSAHGRFERREYELIQDEQQINVFLEEHGFYQWDHVGKLGMVTRYRGIWARNRETKTKYLYVSITRTPYIITTSGMSIEEFAAFVRRHWAIEQAHNTLDNEMLEDHCTSRSGFAPENLSLLRKLAYNLIVMLMERDNSSWSMENMRGFKNQMESLRGNVSRVAALLMSKI